MHAHLHRRNPRYVAVRLLVPTAALAVLVAALTTGSASIEQKVNALLGR
jgi:hypothetical protein